MLDTILFDLDGTLLPMDMNDFLRVYMYEVGKAFSDREDPKVFIANLMASTELMLKNSGNKTNATVFAEDFQRRINGSLHDYLERFERFYDGGYLKLRDYVFPNSIVKSSVELLNRKQYKLVIATNPIFPRKAVLHRIKWAGFDPSIFHFITSYEYCRYCKPNPCYFTELLEMIGKKPEQCIMVGNDAQEDLAAAKVGMKTYLITNHLVNRQSIPYTSTYTGDYDIFHDYVSSLPYLK